MDQYQTSSPTPRTPPQLVIEISDLADKWTRTGPHVCAVCGFNFDDQDACVIAMRGEDEEGYKVPLLLFRGEGDSMEMLAFCWECATPPHE